ncbi:MAG TPA: hypothetical protein VES38_05910 [Methylotenera sp.]|nr:hypothetical protein [Methylotenera sp.]
MHPHPNTEDNTLVFYDSKRVLCGIAVLNSIQHYDAGPDRPLWVASGPQSVEFDTRTSNLYFEAV